MINGVYLQKVTYVTTIPRQNDNSQIRYLSTILMQKFVITISAMHKTHLWYHRTSCPGKVKIRSVVKFSSDSNKWTNSPFELKQTQAIISKQLTRRSHQQGLQRTHMLWGWAGFCFLHKTASINKQDVWSFTSPIVWWVLFVMNENTLGVDGHCSRPTQETVCGLLLNSL